MDNAYQSITICLTADYISNSMGSAGYCLLHQNLKHTSGLAANKMQQEAMTV
jgi:hypothetical protein